MAESICAEMIEKRGLNGQISVASAAAHCDEIGNPPHRGTREKLAREGIPLVPHRAVLMTGSDGEKYDLLIGMDGYNIRDIRRIAAGNEGKAVRLLDFTDHPRDIDDPWYTGDFDKAYDDISEGCAALLDKLEESLSRRKS